MYNAIKHIKVGLMSAAFATVSVLGGITIADIVFKAQFKNEIKEAGNTVGVELNNFSDMKNIVDENGTMYFQVNFTGTNNSKWVAKWETNQPIDFDKTFVFKDAYDKIRNKQPQVYSADFENSL